MAQWKDVWLSQAFRVDFGAYNLFNELPVSCFLHLREKHQCGMGLLERILLKVRWETDLSSLSSEPHTSHKNPTPCFCCFPLFAMDLEMGLSSKCLPNYYLGDPLRYVPSDLVLRQILFLPGKIRKSHSEITLGNR